MRPADIQQSIQRILATLGLVALTLAGCDSDGSPTADTITLPVLTTTIALNPELARLEAARESWTEANIVSYLMTIRVSGMLLGVIECHYAVDNDVSILVEGPLQLVGDKMETVDVGYAVDFCEGFADVESVYAYLGTNIDGADAGESVSVAYDFRGVPTFVQYPGDPETDGGGTLRTSVSEQLP